MLSNTEIQNLIHIPKLIVQKTPSVGYSSIPNYKRCNLELTVAGESEKRFAVFVSQNTNFIENFSIGLRYRTGRKKPASVTLVRYNGAHGEYALSPDGHYMHPRIHRITEKELRAGNIQPQESHRVITDRYATFDQALNVFFLDNSVFNFYDFFPELQRPRLFDGYWQN